MTFVYEGLDLYTIYGRGSEGNWYTIGSAVSGTPEGAVGGVANCVGEHPYAGWVHDLTRDDLRAIPAQLGPGHTWEQPFPMPPGWTP